MMKTTPGDTYGKDYSPINNLLDLKMEQKRVKLRIKLQEEALRSRLRNVPGELVASGARAVIPGFLAGKLTETAIGGLRAGVNLLLDRNSGKNGIAGSLLKGAVKDAGIFGLVKMAYSLFRKKKS